MKKNLKLIVLVALPCISIIFILFISVTNQLNHTQKMHENLLIEQKRKEEQLALENKLREEQAPKKLRHNLQKELDFLNTPFIMTETEYNNADWLVIKFTIEDMNERAKMIQDGLNSDNIETQTIAKEVRSKAIAYQLKAFPILRKAFAKGLNKELWLEDAKAYVSGNDNIYINFVYWGFARNRTMHEFHLNAYKMLTTLRFRQARYRYYDGGEYSYYTVYEGKDADLAL